MDLISSVQFFISLTRLIALAFVAFLFWWIRRQDAGTRRMQEITSYIYEVGDGVEELKGVES